MEERQLDSPVAVGRRLGDVKVGLLQGVGVLGEQATQDITTGGAAHSGGEGVVLLGRERVVVLVVKGEIGRRGDGLVEEQGAEVTLHGDVMVHDGARAGRLARDGHRQGIAAELTDILLDPLESEGLVEKTGIDDSLRSQFGRGEPAESTKLLYAVSSVLVVVAGREVAKHVHDTGWRQRRTRRCWP